MMAQKAAIYEKEGHLANADLLNQLQEAVNKLEEEMKASIRVNRGGHRVGFGVSKAQRGIAADAVISIVRAIKALKGW
jgi:stage III sporulation protein SpoIIIAA